MANQNLVNELLAGGMYCDPQGYWKSRGFEENPGWHKLPFADFFENLSDPRGHKKMWLNPDGTFQKGKASFKCDSLMPLYEGILATQYHIVAPAFFWYSALVVNLHLNLAYYSKKLKCEPNLRACYEAGSDKDKADIKARAMACRAIAFIGYEGDGLGGFAEKSWLFWGRIGGKTPDSVVIKDKSGEVIFNKEIANEDFAYFNSSKRTDDEKKELFYEWWTELHPGYSRAVVDKIYAAHKMVKLYQQLESPYGSVSFEEDNQTHVQAVLCGFFRRSAVGIAEAKAYDSNDLDNPANRFADMLQLGREKMEKLLTGNNGITPFGNYLLEVLDINSTRNSIVDTIVSRQSEDDNTKNSLLSEGFKTKVSKRGRARL